MPSIILNITLRVYIPKTSLPILRKPYSNLIKTALNLALKLTSNPILKTALNLILKLTFNPILKTVPDIVLKAFKLSLQHQYFSNNIPVFSIYLNTFKYNTVFFQLTILAIIVNIEPSLDILNALLI